VQKWRPIFDLFCPEPNKTNEDLFDLEITPKGVFCERRVLGKSRTNLFAQVWGSSGKNPGQPQKFACS